MKESSIKDYGWIAAIILGSILLIVSVLLYTTNNKLRLAKCQSNLHSDERDEANSHIEDMNRQIEDANNLISPSYNELIDTISNLKEGDTIGTPVNANSPCYGH